GFRRSLQRMQWTLTDIDAKNNAIRVEALSVGDCQFASLPFAPPRLVVTKLAVAKDAKLLIDGVQGNLADLKKGAQCAFQPAAGAPTITSIDATRAIRKREKQVDVVLKDVDLVNSSIAVEMKGEATLTDLPVAADAVVSIEAFRDRTFARN